MRLLPRCALHLLCKIAMQKKVYCAPAAALRPGCKDTVGATFCWAIAQRLPLLQLRRLPQALHDCVLEVHIHAPGCCCCRSGPCELTRGVQRALPLRCVLQLPCTPLASPQSAAPGRTHQSPPHLHTHSTATKQATHMHASMTQAQVQVRSDGHGCLALLVCRQGQNATAHLPLCTQPGGQVPPPDHPLSAPAAA